ncbi:MULTISPECIES: UDP-2,4-diacetamido-2,4,6-trideoxy-beta-L-altropyranose hydrolase [unclassified Pseudomonas]|uniref:UDP-2,4-diacetamido-2,4, 6-trideoxy-beta-L-altropyranose hydrolase n=1 Tax=unclassified Pseudomonas TaxID=196821 RepID=UPI001464927A|nr:MULTISPECIES: UDP-2,4-diacetamido-2,4,6-trideoxy-beta-L-altropyranose hydrolase [unclassified Pseudomonas]QJI16868.1 UDP-2,4-diacetamido-2,4,6-trideoxy-beta-L-altropyranose hydrolase [Pseudomonas sp. ADAK21]QJI22970.1 UDP-2,4-diacetamido-2,4,6-trideoxy-beta-L-altropyranose hydrolase [Pseudomonas sp. ADAK20]
MKVVFRADASLQIGSGHVMRCLTLADALRAEGAECHFICREHPGNLQEVICNRGFDVHLMAFKDDDAGQTFAHQSYLCWLGTSQELDAEECSVLLDVLRPDWLIVDHYALDVIWESRLKNNDRKLMVIDDLANRQHISDILLDQTFGRNAADYLPLVPVKCVLLCGSEYALLRPAFVNLRSYSLTRRAEYKFAKLLITLGGVDKDNVTRKVLECLKHTALPKTCHIIVVMGAAAPWLEDIQHLASTLPWHTEVKVNVNDMAQLMSDSDFAIGSAGSTSWERCCLGLPTAMVVLADNQKFAAGLLEQAKAVVSFSGGKNLFLELAHVIDEALQSPGFLKTMSEQARTVVTGAGCEQVLKTLIKLSSIDG